MLESNASEQTEDRSITAMGILNTLETVCSVMESQAEVCHCLVILQRIFRPVVNILQLTVQLILTRECYFGFSRHN